MGRQEMSKKQHQKRRKFTAEYKTLAPWIRASKLRQRVVTRLQKFDDGVVEDLRKAQPILVQLALDAGRRMVGLVEQLAARLDKALAHSPK